MTGQSFNHLSTVLSIMVVLQSGIQVVAFSCGIKNVPGKYAANEKSFTNVTYLLNFTETTPLEQTSVGFDVCYNRRIKTQCTFRWKAQVNDMIAKNWGSGNQTLCSCEGLDLSQSMTWKLTISQLVDRSLSVMHLYVENFTPSEKTVRTIHLIRVEVLYPPRITSLTVDGQEADSSQLIDKGQKVNMSCFYDKGNPPATFRLLDKHGNELAEGESEGNVTYLLSAQCEDDWPTIRCEGNGSEHNRSVSFLVRCPPQFVDSFVTIITLRELENKEITVKAHNTSITECYLTLSSSENNCREEANCTLTGTPPNLVLTLHFNEVKITQGNWTVIIGNELGSTNTTLYIMDTMDIQSTATLDGVLIGLPCGAVLLAAVIAFVVICAKTLVKQQNHDQTDGPKCSIEEDVTTMIVNDMYETSGVFAAADVMKPPSHLDAPPLPPPRTPLLAAEAPTRSVRSRAHDKGSALTAAHHQESHIQPDVSVMDVRERKKISKNKVRFEDREDRKKGKQAKECRTDVAEETDKANAPASLVMPSTSGCRNADGLIYGDLDFTDRKVSDVIIGSASGIEYTRINTSARAPPPCDYKQKYNHKR